MERIVGSIDGLNGPATWQIPLAKPPDVVQTSPWSLHGTRGEERWRLHLIWCLNLYQGEGVLEIGGGRYPIRPGYASITVPNEDMSYRFSGRAYLTWIHFVPVAGAGHTPIPVMQDLGSQFDSVREEIAELNAYYRETPARAAAKLWNVLWRLTAAAGPIARNAVHPAFIRTKEALELHSGESLSAAKLAERADLSLTHLNRLFKTQTGTTVMQYLLRQRALRARHMLMHTTLPIKTIARHVGIPNANLFNKTLHRFLRKGPREIRRDGCELPDFAEPEQLNRKF